MKKLKTAYILIPILIVISVFFFLFPFEDIAKNTPILKTFYNLPYEKRKRISDAIIKEFMERPNEKVSINRIIKTAEISRGSFYQYFDDKVDLIEIITKM